MKTKIIVILSIIALLTGAGAYGFYLGKDLSRIKVDNHNGNPVPTPNGFDIPISILVTNPSRITIPINYVEYSGMLESTGDTLARGTIENVIIKKLDSTWINETVHVDMAKSTKAVADLVLQDNVWVKVNLKMNVFGLSIPYSTRIDIKDALLGNANTISIENLTEDQIEGNDKIIPDVL